MLVVIPFVDKELPLVIKNLRLCMKWESSVSYECLLSYERTTNPSSATAVAAKYFSKVHHHIYDPAPVKRWPDAPNWAWQTTARYIESNFQEPWLWWEADAVPLKANWISILDEEYREAKKPFMGHRVEDMGHLNGVAVYPHNISHYAYNAMLCRAAAWDVVISQETPGQQHECNHLIGHCWNLTPQGQPVNGDGLPVTFPNQQEVKRLIDHNWVLFHRCKDGTLQDRLLEREWKKKKELATLSS